MADERFSTGERVDDWYTGAMAPPASTRATGSGLTTRVVQSVPVDPRTGQPVLAGTPYAPQNPFVKAANAARTNVEIERNLAAATPERFAVDKNGQRVNPISYYAGTSGAPPRPAARPMFDTPMLPVAQASPELLSAYAAVERGEPGALKVYGNMIADEAQRGNIGVTPARQTPVLPGQSAGKAKAATPVLPATIKGRSTGNSYNVGQTYQGTNGYTYQANADGTFTNLGYSKAEQEKRAAQGKAIGEANRKSAGPTYDVSGGDNAFNPPSVQNSVRWQTGY